MLKIKLTLKQYDELNYLASLVDSDEKEVNTFIVTENTNNKYYLLLDEKDIESLLDLTSYYLSAAASNWADSGDRGWFGVASMWRNLNKKVEEAFKQGEVA